jgi:hypothetical protein
LAIVRRPFCVTAPGRSVPADAHDSNWRPVRNALILVKPHPFDRRTSSHRRSPRESSDRTSPGGQWFAATGG